MSRQSGQIPIYVYRYEVEDDPAWFTAAEVDPMVRHFTELYGEVKIVAGPFISREAAERARENLQSMEVLREELEEPKGG